MANGIRCVNRKCGQLQIKHYQRGFHCEVFVEKNIPNRRPITHDDDCYLSDESTLTECSGNCARYNKSIDDRINSIVINHDINMIFGIGNKCRVINIGS